MGKGRGVGGATAAAAAAATGTTDAVVTATARGDNETVEIVGFGINDAVKRSSRYERGGRISMRSFSRVVYRRNMYEQVAARLNMDDDF